MTCWCRGGDPPHALCVRHESIGRESRGQERDARFSCHAALFEAASAELADDLFGLRFGLSRDLRDAGLVAYVILHSATYADAMRNLERYLRLFTQGYHFHLSVEGTALVLASTPLDACVYGCPQAQDFAVATILAVSRSIVHRDLTPMWIEVNHAPPSEPAAAQRLLGAPIHYARGRLAIVVPRSWLDLPIQNADNRLLRVLEGYCREVLVQRSELNDWTAKLERWLMLRLPSGKFATEDAARELGMSPRTLARRFQERGRASRPSPTTYAGSLHSAISRTRRFGLDRSLICLATRSPAGSIMRSVAGPGGRRRRTVGLKRRLVPARRALTYT